VLSEIPHSWLGRPGGSINPSHHGLSHQGDGNAAAWAAMRKIEHFYMQEYAYLLGRLRDTPAPSGQGSVLDHTIVLTSTDIGKSNSHSLRNTPFTMTSGRLFRGGRFVAYPNRFHNDLYVSIAQAFGVQINKFGDYGEGPLAGLR
jgi:hypothetical protein